MTHPTCRLTAKNRDQLRNPTLGNRVWATFVIFIFCACVLLTQPESVGRWKSLSFRKRVVVAVTTAVVVAMIIAGVLVGVWFFLDNTVKIVQV